MSGISFDAAVFAPGSPGPTGWAGDVAARRRLGEMRKLGIRLAVVAALREEVEAAEFEALFDVRLAPEDSAAAVADLASGAIRRLDRDPRRAVLFSGDPACVEAARDGGFGLVVGIGSGADAPVLRERGADLVVPAVAAVSFGTLAAWFENAGERRPSALASFGEIAERIRGRRLAVFLDFDGTLSPIVDHPEEAILAPGMGEALRGLARRCPVVVVSGRGREDVAARVGLPDLVYAGSHGFDIAGPGGLRHEVDPALRERLAAAFRALSEGARGIGGAIVEDKLYSVSVHYRMARDAEVPRLEELVDRVVAADPKLRKGLGKKVFEVRPRLDWDKGRALVWILGALGFEGSDVVPVYVGDDLTDEDAFAALGSAGIGVLVTEAPRSTNARWWLQNPDEVREWLGGLANAARRT